MTKLVKYFVTASRDSFLDFDLEFPGVGISMAGTDVLFTGAGQRDSVYLGTGVNFDFRFASGASDRLFLKSSYSDYIYSTEGTTLILSEKVGGSKVQLAAGSVFSFDQISFLDGTVGSKPLYDAVRQQNTLPALDTEQKSPITVADLLPEFVDLPENTVRAFAASNDGVTFAKAPNPNTKLILTGGAGVDVVYVEAGSKVDARQLSGGVDEIFMTGSFSDYQFSYQGTTLEISRSFEGTTESVSVAGGNAFSFDKLVFSDGFVRSNVLSSAVSKGAELPELDASLKTPGANPTVLSGGLAGIDNLDVRSDIVLRFSEDVQAVSGKTIRIVNDANTATKAGLYGENVTNSFVIDVADPRVLVNGSLVTIRLEKDLDFANNYHIELDAGAFIGQSSGFETAAISEATTLSFSTVTPSNDRDVNSTEGNSVIMAADGAVLASAVWKDIEGWPAGKTGDSATLDLAVGEIALVSADRLDTPSFVNPDDPFDGSAATNVTTGDFNLILDNFGADDLFYLDDVGRLSDDNALTRELIFAIQANSDDTSTNFNFDAATVSGQLKEGGVITVQGQSFATLGEWQTILNTSNEIFIYGSSAPPDIPLTVTSAASAQAAEDQNLLYAATVVANEGTVTYSLSGADAGLLTISSTGEITLKDGDLEYDGSSPKRNYDFVVEVEDSAGSTATKSVQVAVTNVDDEATGTLGISGEVKEGQPLTASIEGLSDPDGGITSTTWRWQVSDTGTTGWVDIGGAAQSTYSIAYDQSQVGKYLRVIATTTDELGGTTTFTKDSGPVANVNDDPVGSVSISGIAQVGQILTASNNLSDADGIPSGAITYQWLADGLVINGATSSSLQLIDAFVDQQISVAAVYTDSFGTEESVASPSVEVTAGSVVVPPEGIELTNDMKAIATENSDTFIVDANQAISAEISGFAPGDTIVVKNLPVGSELNFTDSNYGDGSSVMNAGSAVIDLTNLDSDDFAPTAEGFKSMFGPNSIQGLTTIQTITEDGSYSATSLADIFVIDAPEDGSHLSISIDGFEAGDILAFLDVTQQQGVNITEDDNGTNGKVLMTAGTTAIDMTGLPAVFLNNEAAFLAEFGADSLQYGPLV